MRRRLVPRYSVGEEIAHAVTHGFGVLLAVAGLVALVAVAALHGTARHVVGAAVFGFTLVLLYTASTLYHSIPILRAKVVLRVIDHSAIYLLIAGTYTPFALVLLPPRTGYVLLAVQWTLALAGILTTALWPDRFPRLALVLYLGMGWSAVTVARPLVEALDAVGIAFLVGGGLAYTVGVGFFVLQRMKYHHAVWHVFVLAGSVLHFFAVLSFLLPG